MQSLQDLCGAGPARFVARENMTLHSYQFEVSGDGKESTKVGGMIQVPLRKNNNYFKQG